jgi:hypothetical protein
MAKPITVTPVISGAHATKIANEMKVGTPQSPQRTKLLQDADRAFASLKNSPFGRQPTKYGK